MPTREQLAEASRIVREAGTSPGGPTVLFVLPDYFADRPKPCMGGWGRLALIVNPTGLVLPCHEAGEIPGLDFWNVKDNSVQQCCSEAPGMQAYRGTDWMPEPCRSCPEKERDFGGCRCQAFHLLGDAQLTDPACNRSPEHDRITTAQSEFAETWQPRR
jgi:pyrroloquinoline quinone biosynthesis protein E